MLESPRPTTLLAHTLRRTGIPDAIAFYTGLPVPANWLGDFTGVARVVPLIGVLIGLLLGGIDWGLQALEMPLLTRSALLAIAWVGITGGLHLDGAMDTADGLAVSAAADAEALQQRRLQAMSDSATGAFGAMAAIALLLLKTAALCDLTEWRWLGLVLSAGWGRWGQQVAIVRYPYLKPTGKGAFHKAALRSGWDLVPGVLLLSGFGAVPLVQANWSWSGGAVLGGGAIAAATSAWFNRQLGGQTGDTYGAVVEWTEALFLVLLTVL